MLFRSKPWEIQLDWETVHEGRRVYWCACQHDGTVQVYPGGLAGRTVGILSFSLDSSILKRDTNYTPKDAGFGSLVSMVYNAVSGNAQTGALTETSVNGQRAWEFEMSAFTHPRLAKATVAVSETTGLPVRLVGWNAAGELTEKYSWYDTEVNPSLSDADFPTGYAE